MIEFFNNESLQEKPITHSEKLAESIKEYLRKDNKAIELHYGPGSHPSGTPQTAHGDRDGGEAKSESGKREKELPDIPTRNIVERAIAGGFSYQPFTQEYPDSGYMYSIWTDREKVIPLGEVTSEALEEYVIENADLLSQDNHYFGGWIEDDNLYLDVSKRNENLDDALAEADANEQLAIFDLNNLETIYTEYYYSTQERELEPA